MLFHQAIGLSIGGDLHLSSYIVILQSYKLKLGLTVFFISSSGFSSYCCIVI